MRKSRRLWVGVTLLVSSSVFAVEPGNGAHDGVESHIPECMAYHHSIPINNEQVLHFKRTTPNQFQERAHVRGTISRVYEDHSGHHHFELSLGSRPDSTIEVIYNEAFGRVPDAQIGMNVEACGDYITSIAPAGPYPESPDGAIIHWVHKNPKPYGHPSGFLVMDGRLCGQEVGN